MVHWFLYYLLQSLRLYFLCGYASPAAHVTQPRQTRMGMRLLPIPMMWGTCLLWGYFLGGGRNAARDSTELLLAADNLGSASQTWIIKKSWISESGQAMVLSSYPGQMTPKPSTT